MYPLYNKKNRIERLNIKDMNRLDRIEWLTNRKSLKIQWILIEKLMIANDNIKV